MDCRHTILINNRFLWVKIRTLCDYNNVSEITLKEWLQPMRYEIGFIRGFNGYKWWINKSKSIWH